MPKEEIAFIHTADTDAKKKELFAKVRSGQVRVHRNGRAIFIFQEVFSK